MMDELPSELAAFALLLEAQLPPVREAFQYCVCLMMIEKGKMRLVETLPGESTPLCVFETIEGERFRVNRPNITSGQEADLLEALRDIILRDEGLL